MQTNATVAQAANTKVETTTNTGNGAIRQEKHFGKINIDDIVKSAFQKAGTMTVILSQEVVNTSYYPSQRVDNNLQDNLFGAEEFGFKEQVFTAKEKRVAFVIIPEAEATKEIVQARLDKLPNAKIYRILANHPILSENQGNSIERGLKTTDDFANAQVVRVPDNEETQKKGTAGKILLDRNNKIQYRRTFFSAIGKEDEDLRTKEPNDYYVSAAIKEELTNASVIDANQKM
jgi:hypothetical protein